MASRSRRPLAEEPPADWVPTQAVEDPVINKPYEEPTAHWVYRDGVPEKVPTRRPASYYYRTKKVGEQQADLFAEEERDELPLVNALRADVRRWREAGYRGASAVTKDLLAHWTAADRPRRLFFCQREAVETLIYLLDIAIPGRLASTGFRNFQVNVGILDAILKGEKTPFAVRDPDFHPRLVDRSTDAALLPLRRMACKMATGSGKTVVMAMLVAWAFCNRGRNPASTAFPNAVLICAPNLTVRKRLRVLRPEEHVNYYDEFDILPAKYRELLGAGKVLVTNWHVFTPKSEHREGDSSHRVVQKGEETPEAFARDRLGDLALRMPILVLNDEGHHCWRPKVEAEADGALKEAEKGLTKEEKESLKEEVEEARVWLAGLDRINNSGLASAGRPGVLACVDLSATPFYLSGSGYPQGSPFPWIVSDFGLVDAIESGIVKIPRLPVRDDTRSKDDVGKPDPKYFRLWRRIGDDLRPVDRLSNRRPKPEAVYREAEGALIMLASQWKQKFENMEARSPGERIVPPVLIVVCDNTEIAEVVFREVSGEKAVEVPAEEGKGVVQRTVYQGSEKFPFFANEEGVRRTIRIDSKLLKKLETEEGETRDQAAKALREVIDTIGRRGGAGEQVRCVVSVSMLTEGWDASNVTHVLGIRAFDSQLLCEQVVGRGLRRMDYRPDLQTGKLAPEFVDVYGIPFSLIPFKGKPKDDSGKDPVYHPVYPVPERKHLEIRMPIVESYTYEIVGSGIRCDVERLQGFVVSDEPTRVYLVMTRGYQDEPAAIQAGEFVEQTREAFYAQTRFQQIVFRIAQMIMDDLIATATGQGAEALRRSLLARHQLFPHLVRIVQEYVEKKLRFAPAVDRRELGLEKYSRLLCERVREGIVAHAPKDTRLLPIINSYKPSASTSDANYRTTRPVVPLVKSHLNFAVLHSGWEKDAVDILEDLDGVEAYSPNDRNVGFAIPYSYLDAPFRYEPDFIVRLRGGQHVVLEIKGGAGEVHDPDRVEAKNVAAHKWVRAVNEAGRFGRWEFEICRDLGRLRATLARYAGDDGGLPFRAVAPGPEDRYRTCVPLTSLRAAASRWSEEQASLEFVGDDDVEWITWDTRTRFEQGMFVARVLGDSMEPQIPDGAYCLFRAPRGGSRSGNILLVRHSGITDPHTGGEYTVKVYTSEKAVDADGGWAHTRIVLKPLNPKHEPIELTATDDGDVREIAEFVEVVEAPSGS